MGKFTFGCILFLIVCYLNHFVCSDNVSAFSNKSITLSTHLNPSCKARFRTNTNIHSRPSEFKYSYNFSRSSSFLIKLRSCWADIEPGIIFEFKEMNLDYKKMLYIPSVGIKIWIENDISKKMISLVFKDVASFDTIFEFVSQSCGNNQKKDNKIRTYRFKLNMWWWKENYSGYDQKDFFGYDDIFERIYYDMDNLKLYSKYLDKIDSKKPLNYLLHGPPGSGKKSLVKVLATKYSMPLFIINGLTIEDRELGDIGEILSPDDSYYEYKILLFENFDVFLLRPDVQSMIPTILNCLDESHDSGKIVRFFTARNNDFIHGNERVFYRFSRLIKFNYPTRYILRSKLNSLINIFGPKTETKVDLENKNKFLDIVMAANGITVGTFVNYCLRFISVNPDKYLKTLIEHHEEFYNEAAAIFYNGAYNINWEIFDEYISSNIIPNGRHGSWKYN